MSQLASELSRFEWLTEQLKTLYPVQALGQKSLVIGSVRSSSEFAKSDKDVGLCVAGCVHGNETVGLQIANGVLQAMLEKVIEPTFPLGIVIGNLEAMQAGTRFIRSDMNRSFGREVAENSEHQRCKEMEKLLLKSQFFIDFHQTIAASREPFYIFPYADEALDFASSICSELPIVTHWGKPFSKIGMCSDEFVNFHGGLGITVELGQAGFDFYQASSGIRLVLDAIGSVESYLKKGKFQPRPFAKEQKYFTFAQVKSVPDAGSGGLEPGWYNFANVEKGQKLGIWDGEPVLADQAGWILFPKYFDPKAGQSPGEWFRILKRIEREQIGVQAETQ